MLNRFAVTATAAAVLLAGCSSVRIAEPTQTDSVRVEIRERLVHDTAIVEVARDVERIVTRDTASHLENEWASSDAAVSEGYLTHSLASKPRTIKVPVIVTVHDTTVVERQAETIVERIEVERSPSFREQLFFRLGILFAVLAFLQIAYLVIKHVCHK